jgi:hypothetical protein
VAFHLNQALRPNATTKTNATAAEEKVPLEHKFVMTPLGGQDIFILKQSEENSKGKIFCCVLLSILVFSFNSNSLSLFLFSKRIEKRLYL